MRSDSLALEKIINERKLWRAPNKVFEKEIEGVREASGSIISLSNGVLNPNENKSCVRNIFYNVIDGQCPLPNDEDFYQNHCEIIKCTSIFSFFSTGLSSSSSFSDTNWIKNTAGSGKWWSSITVEICTSMLKKYASKWFAWLNYCRLSKYLILAKKGFQADETREMVDLVDPYSKFAVSMNGLAHTSMKRCSRKHGSRVTVSLPNRAKVV